jgi:hypothetical protein
VSTGLPDDDLADLPWPKPEGPSSECSRAIRERCTQGLCAKRGATAGQRLGACLAISALTLLLTYWLAKDTGQPDHWVRAAGYGAVGWGIVLAAVLFAGLARPPGRRGSKNVRLAIAFLMPIVFLGYAVVAATHSVSFETFSQGEYAAHAFRCGLIALFIGALVSGGILLSFRHTDPLTPGISGALAGLAGGITSALGVGIACPSTEAWHACFSHGLAVVALVLLGWRFGRRVLSP